MSKPTVRMDRRLTTATTISDWETGLVLSSTSDDNWSASIGMVIPMSGIEDELVNWLLNEIKSGNRQRFKAITYNETLQMVEGGLDQRNRSKSRSPVQYNEVLSTAKTSLAETGQLAPELIAKLIKFQIIVWKTDSIRETSNSTPKSDKSKSPKPSSTNVEPSRVNRLKYRVGEGPPAELTCDEPSSGPNLYILLFGFHDASLIPALEFVNLSLDTVIKVQLIWSKSAAGSAAPSTEDLRPFQIPGMLEAEKILNKILVKFWNKIKNVFVYAEPTSQLHDVIFQDLQVLSSEIPSIMCATDKQNSFRATMYTNLAKLMYKIQDLKRQYQSWLNSISFVHIPSFEDQKVEFFEKIKLELGLQAEEEIPLHAQLTLPDRQHYHHLIESIPNECCTVPVILHCLIEQVVDTVDREKKCFSQMLMKEECDNVSTRLEKMFDKCMLNFTPPMQYLPPVNSYNPLLIYYGDELRTMMHHFSGHLFDLECTSIALIKTHPVLKALLEFPEISTQQRNMQMARYQNLLSLFTLGEVTVAEIDWALKLLSFESMVIQTSDLHGNINKCLQAPIPWDDPYSLGVTSAEMYSKSQDRNFPIVCNFTKGGKTVCCASESKNRLITITSKSTHEVKFCNGSKDLIQCECMIRKNEKKNGTSKSNKSLITNSRCNQCSKAHEGVCHIKSSTSLHFSHFRNLQDFNYVEFYPPNVFQQVLNQALNILHCVDIIYHKRDPCHLLVLHNPLNWQKHCCMLWNTNMNTNVSLRNFQLHVLPSVVDWIDRDEVTFENCRRTQDVVGKRSVTDGDQTMESTPEYSLAKIVGDSDWVPQSILNSLKYQKMEEESLYSPVGPTSNLHGESFKLVMKDQDEKKHAKTKPDFEAKKLRHDSVYSIEPLKRRSHSVNLMLDEGSYNFQGYEVGNLILHISGTTNYIYPSCKSQIWVEKYVYVEGRERVKITVYDQGNYLYIHPPIIERTGKWSDCVQLVLFDGIFVHVKRDISILLLSQDSKTTESIFTSEDVIDIDKQSIETNSIDSSASNLSSSTITPHSSQIEGPLCLTFTLPNSLIIQIKADPEQDEFVVRQFFMDNESNDELCRTVTLNGNVIRTLKKNRTEILQPDGSVLKTDWSLFTEEIITSKAESVATEVKLKTNSQDTFSLTVKDSKSTSALDFLQPGSSQISLIVDEEEEEEISKGASPSGPPWSVLTPAGRQFEVQMGVWTLTEQDCMLAYRAIDPGTKEEYQAREDGLHIVHKRNRHYIAHHYEGTRITTYFKRDVNSTFSNTEPNTIQVEKPPFVSVTTNPQAGTFEVQLSQNFYLLVKSTGTCVIHQKNGTQFAYHTDGSLLFTPECSNCVMAEKARPFTTFVVYPYEETILETFDHMGQQFTVKSNGTISVAGVSAEKSEEEILLNQRYFVAYPDGSGSEFIHEKQAEEILNRSAENSLCQIDSNLLPNNLYVEGFQIFNPMAKTSLDAWATSYEMESIIPSGLTSKDLQPIPPLAYRDHRYTFGCGVGNGLHIKPLGNLNIPTGRSSDYPQVWQLRNFLKFRKMTPEWRELFQNRIKDLNEVLKQFDFQKQRARVSDFRPNTEQQLSASLLSLAKATGLPKKRLCKGIKSYSAGEEKSVLKTKSAAQNKSIRSNSLHLLCSEIRFHQNRLSVYRTTNYLPSFFKCQLAKEALIKIKEIPKLKGTKSSNSIASVKEKTPPLLQDRLMRKQKNSRVYTKPTITKRELEEKAAKAKQSSILPPLPGWANVEALLPREGKIKRAKFIMRPVQVDFGLVKEGNTLRHRVYLKNSGIENSAVKIKQPPKATGISVSCTPLLVMAGMQATLDVELYALLPASVNENGEGRVYHELEIRTDIETIYLPITATVTVVNENVNVI